MPTKADGVASARNASRKPLPPTVFEGTCRAPAETVYDLLADLNAHLEWAGARQSETTRLLTMEASPGPATVGTEFRTSGSDGKVARWHDRSVVTEADRPSVFEFVTEGQRFGKPGKTPMEATTVHRYTIESSGSGCRVIYRGQITSTKGFPAIVRAPLIGGWLLGYSAKYMRKGFDGLISMAEDRAGTA